MFQLRERFFGWRSEACLSTNAQAFSMGLRSGERGGHCSRVIYSGTLACNQSCVNFVVRFGSLLLDMGPVSAREPISRCRQHSGFKDRDVERCGKILRKKEERRFA